EPKRHRVHVRTGTGAHCHQVKPWDGQRRLVRLRAVIGLELVHDIEDLRHRGVRAGERVRDRVVVKLAPGTTAPTVCGPRPHASPSPEGGPSPEGTAAAARGSRSASGTTGRTRRSAPDRSGKP